MTTHHLSPEEIAAYLDGECTETESRAAQTHLDACAECRQIADDQQFIMTLMGSLQEPELPRSFAVTADLVEEAPPLISPVSAQPPPTSGSNLVRFEPFAKFLSIAAVIAFLVLGGAQMAGIGDSSQTANQAIELSETDSSSEALQSQEPALARGEVREQGESAAANAAPLIADNTLVDTQTRATNNGLTAIEITTIGVGIVALASIAGWILIHYRAGDSSSNT